MYCCLTVRLWLTKTSFEQAKVRSLYTGDERIRDQERDEAKFWRKCNVRISLLGFENPNASDPDMPIRVIGYDGAAYRDQLYYEKGENGKQRRNTEQRYPVVTLVLYFGDKPWTGAKTLYENLTDIPNELRPFVSDYRINQFEIAFLSDETVKKFKSDFRIIADYFVQIRKNKEYIASADEISHVYETLKIMSYLTKDQRFEQAYYQSEKGDEPKNMCEALDIIENRGIAKGLAVGFEKANLEAIKNVKAALNVSDEQAMDILKIPKEEQKKYFDKL